MPYDDSDVKRMIKYQTERKVGFSRSKRISDEVKDLIHCILEANVERRYTVEQITKHPWMLPSAIVGPSSAAAVAAAASRAQTPAATVAAPSGGTRVTIIAGETGAGGRVTATATPAAVGNDSSQNNNSNAERVLSRFLGSFFDSVHSFFPSSTTDIRTTRGELQLAAHYAIEAAIDRERLRDRARKRWSKRRSSLHLALRRPWR